MPNLTLCSISPKNVVSSLQWRIQGEGHGGHDPPLGPRGTTGLPRAPVRALPGPQRAPQAWQGHHRPLRGHHRPAKGLSGPQRAPQARQGQATGLSGSSGPQKCNHSRPARGYQSEQAPPAKHGTPQRPVRDTTGFARSTTGLSGAPARGTTGLPGAPHGCQGHHLLAGAQGTTGLLGALQASQGHHRPSFFLLKKL